MSTAARKTPNFDTAELRDGLVNASVADQSARAIVDAMVESQSNLATKTDLQTGLKELDDKIDKLDDKVDKLGDKLMDQIALSEQKMRNFALTQTIIQLTALIGAVYVLLKFGI